MTKEESDKFVSEMSQRKNTLVWYDNAQWILKSIKSEEVFQNDFRVLISIEQSKTIERTISVYDASEIPALFPEC